MSLALAILFVVALSLRLRLTFSGGIWADEGLVINILAIPTVADMLKFLATHESHPPLFYLMMRGWRVIGGGNDASLLSFVSVIAALIVPVAYLAGQMLFSRRAGLFAAALVAISPSLIDHGSQLRPYGLLPVLVAGSAAFLITSLQHGGVRRWTLWAISTAALLYTHNWTWLVFGAEIVVASVVILWSRPLRRRRAVELAVFAIVIALMFAPWLPALLHQLVHAGHTAPPLNSAVDRILFIVLGMFTVPYHLLLGLYPPRVFPLVLIGGAVAIVVAGAYALSPGVFAVFRSRGIPDAQRPRPDNAFAILLGIPAVSLAAALLMSPRSNLLLERCVAMLAPLVLLAIASRLATATADTRAKKEMMGWAVTSFLVVLFIANLVVMLPTQRSNAREVASGVRTSMRADDLLLVVPEWFAPSFNHYFPRSLEQYDYPHPGRSGLLDFSDVRTRGVDTTALLRLRGTIARARAANRRVWLISSRKYLDYIENELPKLSDDAQRKRYTSVLRLKEAQETLVEMYGSPDTSHVVRERVYRNEDIVPLLFVPSQNPVQGSR